MRTKHHLCCLLIGCLGLPLLASAQSLQSGSVVSVRQLRIPSKARHSFEKGVQLLAKRDAAGSLPHFQQAIEQFAGYYEAYYEMGEADLQLSRIADAEQVLRKSIELSGDRYPTALLALGAVLDSGERFAEAEEVTRKALALDPSSWSGHYYLGMALFGQDRLEDAEEHVHEALLRKPDSIQALRLLADIHGRERDYPGFCEGSG